MTIPNSWFKIGIFLVLLLGCTFHSFPNLQRDFGVFECCSIRSSQVFQIHEKKGNLGFLNMNLGCTFKYFPIYWRVRKLIFLRLPWFHVQLDCEHSLSGIVFIKQRGGSNLPSNIQFKRKRNVHIYITIINLKARKH